MDDEKVLHPFEKKPHPWNEAGRRLVAALLSVQLNLRSVDYTLKHYVPDVVPEGWAELAENLIKETGELIARKPFW